jgi:hypothetical protein
MVSMDGPETSKRAKYEHSGHESRRKRDPDPLGCLAPSLFRMRLAIDFHRDPSAGDWFQAERVSDCCSRLKGNSWLKIPLMVSFAKTSL